MAEVGQGLEPEARQGDLRMDGAIPLLVVGLELREAPRSDRAGTSRWPRGRVVRLERIAVGRRHVRCGRPAVLARTGGTILPVWIGFCWLALVQLCRRRVRRAGRAVRIEIASI